MIGTIVIALSLFVIQAAKLQIITPQNAHDRSIEIVSENAVIKFAANQTVIAIPLFVDRSLLWTCSHQRHEDFQYLIPTGSNADRYRDGI